MKKFAVLAMDVEDWFHLDYFLDSGCDRSQSAMDGLNIYLELLKKYRIKTTFFVVGELVEKYKDLLLKIIEDGHELALHSYYHYRPLSMSLDSFIDDTLKSIEIIRKQLDYEVKGYRAPCFSMDRKRLNVLKDLGLKYDASKIDFKNHNLYGSIDINDFEAIAGDIYAKDGFFEFVTSTVNFMWKPIPISGGGYLRIFPWRITRFLLKKYMKENGNYFFYVHPFEFSKNYEIKIPNNTLITKLRFNCGRRTVQRKIDNLIKLLHNNEYTFVRFEDLLVS